MELIGSTADRWEQICNKLEELAANASDEHKLVNEISSTLNELSGELDKERKTLKQLSKLAHKEVLREESGTLNDEVPTFEDDPKGKVVPEKTGGVPKIYQPPKKTEDVSRTDSASEEKDVRATSDTAAPVADLKQVSLFEPEGE